MTGEAMLVSDTDRSIIETRGRPERQEGYGRSDAVLLPSQRVAALGRRGTKEAVAVEGRR